MLTTAGVTLAPPPRSSDRVHIAEQTLRDLHRPELTRQTHGPLSSGVGGHRRPPPSPAYLALVAYATTARLPHASRSYAWTIVVVPRRTVETKGLEPSIPALQRSGP